MPADRGQLVNGSERFLGLLGDLLARRERERAAARPARVLGRHEDGTERLQRLDASCVTRASRDNHYTGTIVLNPGLSTIHRTGTTGITTVTEIASAPTLWIERLDPSAYQPGRTYTVTVAGRGFDDRVWIDFLEPAPPYAQAQTINPDIEVLTLEVLDPETLLLEIKIAPRARLYPARVPIAYGRK
jgi:GAF domain-containing protein